MLREISTVTMTSFLLVSSTYAAKPFTVEAKCPVQVINPAIAPKNLPDYFYGEAKHVNKEQACIDAKRIAT